MAGQLNGLNTDDHKDTFFLLFFKGESVQNSKTQFSSDWQYNLWEQ